MPTAVAARSPAVPRLGAARHLPSLVELLLVLAAIAVLWPFFARVAELGPGRDRRFLDSGIAVAGLPEASLPATCDAVGAGADAPLAVALCPSLHARTAPLTPPRTLPRVLATALARAEQAFTRPLQEAELHLRALRADGGGEQAVREHADAVAALEADLAPFRARFQLAGSADEGPAPIRCAARWVEGALVAPGSAGGPTGDAGARANAVLLLAAALDGRGATASLARDALLPASRATRAAAGEHAGACQGPSADLAAMAALMADARESTARARKNEAMRALTGSAGAQWAGAMALGFVFLTWSRRAASPGLWGIAAALGTWAAAAWFARVPWPLAGAHDFVPGRVDVGWASAPSGFVLVLAASAALVAAAALLAAGRGGEPVRPAQSMSSRLGYPGLVFATGLGWLVLLDLSLEGHPGNRYLALYHQGHLWLAMLALSVLLFARRSLARTFAWLLSAAGAALQRATRRFGTIGIAALLVIATAAALLAFGIALANKRQLTSELGRVWLIVGAAWFFFLRGAPLTARLARGELAALSFIRYAWPMLFVVGVLIAAMFLTSDMGPLLIAGYASGAFLAAALAMWWHHRSGQVAAAFVLALGLFVAWIGAITAALFQVGAHDSVTASRLESVAAPFASINDQLALVSWFQRAAPADGFGIGAAPWCGLAATRGCSGVPAQIHSDYTFTAIVGLFGPLAAWSVSVAMALWLHRLIRHHGRVTRGEPRLVDVAGRIGHDGQALLSWIAVAWVVMSSCQLAVTVAGNLAVLPLTGVTVPFVSFGMTSLLVNMAFLALCLNVDLPPPRASHG